MKDCTRHEVGLALLAAGDEDEAAARHVATCETCAAELTATRALLQAVERTAPVAPVEDARFWNDFTRGVRLAHDEAARRPAWFWVWSLAAAGAALALFVWVRGALPRQGPLSPPPTVAIHEPPALPVGDDPAELDDAELDAILLALDDSDSDSDSDDNDLAVASVDEIDATLDELPTAALDTVAEHL